MSPVMGHNFCRNFKMLFIGPKISAHIPDIQETHLKNMVAKNHIKQRLMESNGSRRCTFRIKIAIIWMDWSHTKKI
jgi:hypothetical protein